MRLYEYITGKGDIMVRENDPSLDELLTVLERDCKKFINETGGFLYRGTNRRLGSETIYAKQTAREDRRPVDTPRMVHSMADTLFNAEFGWKVRSQGVFSATHPSMTKGYGANLYLVFPIGDFKYVWSEESEDFYITQSTEGSKWRNKDKANFNVDLVKRFPLSVMQDIVGMYTDKNLKKAWADRMAREVILNVPNGYYYVSSLAIGELSYYLGIHR